VKQDHPSAFDIAAALAYAGRAVEPDRSCALAEEIRARGGIDRACTALAADESALLPLLLAYRAALDEGAEPDLRLRRLRSHAQDLETRAEALWREAAQDAGVAAGRRMRSEPDLAETFERRAAAAEALAAELEAQAFAARLEAAQIEAGETRRRDLVLALEALAA
jgi:hypothetical protein